MEDRNKTFNEVCVLWQGTTYSDVKNAIDYAVKNQIACVCIPPYYVAWARKYAPKSIKISTVISYPFGLSTTVNKANEVKLAVKSSVNEIETCINHGELRNGNVTDIVQELKQLKRVSRGALFKVFVNFEILNDAEIKLLFKIFSIVSVDYICFEIGDNLELVEKILGQIKNNLGRRVKLKISYNGESVASDLLANYGFEYRTALDFFTI